MPKQCGIVYEEPYPIFCPLTVRKEPAVCHGFGDLAVLDEGKIVPDKNKSLEEGAIEPWTKPASHSLQKRCCGEEPGEEASRPQCHFPI